MLSPLISEYHQLQEIKYPLFQSMKIIASLFLKHPTISTLSTSSIDIFSSSTSSFYLFLICFYSPSSPCEPNLSSSFPSSISMAQFCTINFYSYFCSPSLLTKIYSFLQKIKGNFFPSKLSACLRVWQCVKKKSQLNSVKETRLEKHDGRNDESMSLVQLLHQDIDYNSDQTELKQILEVQELSLFHCS